jgi:hypothetical protein
MCVIDHDFACEEDHRQVVAEGPGLDNVGERPGDRLAAVEPCKVAPRVQALGARLAGALFPLGTRGEGSEIAAPLSWRSANSHAAWGWRRLHNRS